MNKFKIGLICGGPSLERGISINSTRSVMDHLYMHKISIYYVSKQLIVYLLDPKQIYANTPEDFDFKLQEIAEPMLEEDWVRHMKNQDIVFPLIHGTYGEDGQVQALLERHHIAFVGSDSESCKKNVF